MSLTSTRRAIHTTGAPVPPPFLSQAIAVGDLVFCSGQVGSDATTGALMEGPVEERAKQILKNLGAVLRAAGCSMDDVIKANIYLTNMSDFAAVNKVYAEAFSDPKPARTCVGARELPLGTDVEIECIAYKPRPKL